MGGYAKFCIENMFGWLKSFVQQIWALFSGQNGNTILGWIGDNWKVILLCICVAGAAADLVVYIFRWEPFKVWKSYFRRRKNHMQPVWSGETNGTDYYGYDEPEEATGAMYDDGYQPVNGAEVPDTYLPEDAYDDPDSYSYAEAFENPEETPADDRSDGPMYYEPNKPVPPEYHAMYKRPEQNGGNYQEYQEPGNRTERNLEKVIGPRRRKLRVNELFRNADENSVHYEAPRPVIDRDEAYHTPVFPRNWKDNGEAKS